MHSIPTHFHRLLCVVALCALVPALHAGAATTPKAAPPPTLTPAQAEYAKAVAAYIAAATAEVAAHHTVFGELQKDASADVQRRVTAEAVKPKFDRWDQTLEILKKANQTSFDKSKADYESARDVAIKALNAAKGPAPAAPATPAAK